MPKTATRACALSLGALLAAAAAAPSFAQTVVDELTVTGRYGVGPEVRSLSAAVSYRDLDLTTEAGRAVLRQRVKDTARDLCERLGEANTTDTPLIPSCERAAVDSASRQERFAFLNAPPLYPVAPPDQAYVAPAGTNPADEAPAAPSYGTQAATITNETVTNGPVPDTPQNRSAYGGPMSNGGRRTTPSGN